MPRTKLSKLAEELIKEQKASTPPPVVVEPEPVEAPMDPWAAMPVPYGYAILINRAPVECEFFYNGNSFKVKEYMILPAAIAHHGRRKSIIKWNPTGESLYQLGIYGKTDCSPLPMEKLNRIELLDRSSIEGGKDAETGQKLHPEVRAVPGAKVLEQQRTVSGVASFEGDTRG